MWAPLEGGGGSKLDVGHDCGGRCKPKDGAKVSEQDHFRVNADDNIVSDVKGDHQRARVIKSAAGVTVTTA